MIEREDGKVTVTLGDGDLLIGCNCLKGTYPLVRLWFAPLPETWSHPLNTVVPMPKGTTPVPEDAAVVMLFLERANLDGLIDQLTQARDKSFPLPAEQTGDVP